MFILLSVKKRELSMSLLILKHHNKMKLQIDCTNSSRLQPFFVAISAFLSVNPSHIWIVDSGASDHITVESTLFSSYSSCVGNQKIKIANDSFSVIACKGSVVLSLMLTLKNVLHIPNLSFNLMYVSKLVQDINCQTIFFPISLCLSRFETRET